MTGELPIRVIDQPGGPVLRCLCGAESSTLRRGTVNRSMPGLRGSGPAQLRAGPDMSPAALVIMAAHARSCERGRELLSRV